MMVRKRTMFESGEDGVAPPGGGGGPGGGGAVKLSGSQSFEGRF